MQSLCGNSYGCSSLVDGAIGEEMDWAGIYTCSRCTFRAKSIVQFLIGEEIEFVPTFEEWMKSSQVLDRLFDTLLGRALQAQGLIPYRPRFAGV